MLAYDTFNVTRSEERIRLANRASKASTNTVKDIYNAEALSHDLDIFCLHLAQRYEEQRFEVVTYDDDDEEPPPLQFPVYPYLVHGGGSIFYAAPGAGKSLTMQAMAIEVAGAGAGLWHAEYVIAIDEQRNTFCLNGRRSFVTLVLQ